MSQAPLPPLDPELSALLDGERHRPGPPAAVQSEVSARLTELLGGAALVGGNPRTSPTTPSLAGRWVRPSLVALVAGLAIGGAAGSRLQAGLDGGRVQPSPVLGPSAVEVAVPPPVASVAPLAPGVSSPAVIASARPTLGSPTSLAPSAGAAQRSNAAKAGETDADLAAERALIETARSAVARGNAGAALDAVAQHQRRFPRGQLGEEREVLAVQALVAAGRVQEAAERGARFRLQYPNSALLPVVDAALSR
jgi:TolA-binding protein